MDVNDRIAELEQVVNELTRRVNSLHEVQKQIADERKAAEKLAAMQQKQAADAERDAARAHAPAQEHAPRKHK